MAFRFLALGDSYTAGEGVKPKDRWPDQLARLLIGAGCPVEKPRVVARTGWTTADLIEGVRQASITGFFDMVTLLIGVNNQYQGLPVADYEDEFRVLLDQAVRYAQGHPERVLILSIPDWGKTPFAVDNSSSQITLDIDAFNRVNQKFANKGGHPYLDITPLSRSLAANDHMLVADGLHPSKVQYAQWAELIYPVARRLSER